MGQCLKHSSGHSAAATPLPEELCVWMILAAGCCFGPGLADVAPCSSAPTLTQRPPLRAQAVKFTGKAAWVIGTVGLVIGFPLVFGLQRHDGMIEMEKAQEAQMLAQGYNPGQIQEMRMTGNLPPPGAAPPPPAM